MLRPSSLVAVVWLLCQTVSGQGSPFACCYGHEAMTYGPPCDQSLPGIRTWEDFSACWARSQKHFSNQTVVGEYNLTAAEKYSIFALVLDSAAPAPFSHPTDQPPLQFDADMIPNGSVPELGYLPFELMVLLPSSQNGSCPTFDLHNLQIELSLHRSRARPAGRDFAGFSFSINGCGRAEQKLSNLTFKALGYGNLQLSFLSLELSNILSIEPPLNAGTHVVAGDALQLTECDVKDTRVRYFGDVTGQLGNTYGWTQNGSRASGCSFAVADPEEHVPDYTYREKYQFAWYGSYPQEWGSAERFAHMQDSSVEYIRDLQLGSVNLSSTTFTGWLHPHSPIFRSNSSMIPPSVTLYCMESGGDRTFGTKATNCTFEYLWDADILHSAAERCVFRWLSGVSTLGIPAVWGKVPAVNPSFWISLDSNGAHNGFRQILDQISVCLRPALPRISPAQVPTIDQNSTVTHTWFDYANASRCARSEVLD